MAFATQSGNSPSFEEVYAVCSAVVAVFGEPLVWEIQPVGDTPTNFDARLSIVRLLCFECGVVGVRRKIP